MKVAPYNPDTLKEAVEVLRNGGVIAHPADTCFGLTADLMNPDAFKKIQEIKGRDSNKPMSIMISVPEQLHMEDYVVMDDFSKYVSYKLYPSPATILFPKGPKIPDYYFPDHKFIGLRVPMHDLTQDLLRAFGGALITTSANISGCKLNFNHEDTVKCFKRKQQKPDLVFEGHLTRHDKASTVIDVEDDQVTIFRKGPITASHLESILGVPVNE